MITNQPARQLSVTRERDPLNGKETYLISFPPGDPPDVYFDTHVWLNMSQSEEQVLQVLRNRLRHRYRYSITNYVELLSQLAKKEIKGWKNPFKMIRSAFRKIKRLCEPEVLPAPEMQFLEAAGLSHYVHPAWIPDVQQTATAVELIAKAETIGDITGMGIQTPASMAHVRWVLDPGHYLRLTQIDDKSMKDLMEELSEYTQGSLTKENIDRIQPWFHKLAVFFLLYRPSNGRTSMVDLSSDERNRFWQGFTLGVGRMFHAHITLVAIKTANWKERIEVARI